MPPQSPVSGELPRVSPRTEVAVVHQWETGDWIISKVQPHEQAVRRFLHDKFPSLDVDDVVQESYLKLLGVRTTAQIVSAKAYFFSVARNTARTFFRRQQIYSDVAVNDLPPSLVLAEGPNAAETANLHQRIEAVTAAIENLPSQCREIIKLRMLRGLTTRAIAEQLGLAEVTVRVQLARGVKKCAERLGAWEQRDE